MVAVPALNLLPDVIHEGIVAYLGRHGQSMPVAQTCKALLRPYGGRVDRFVIGYRSGDKPNLGALRGLVTRQEALYELCLHEPSLHPTVADAIIAGAGRELSLLGIGSIDEPPTLAMGEAAALAGVFQTPTDALPALERLAIKCKWPRYVQYYPWGGLDISGLVGILDGLADGRSPVLEGLWLALDVIFQARGRVLDCLATALAARRALGCPGLHHLELGRFDWLHNWDLDVLKPLWAAVLPTITGLPWGDHDERGRDTRPLAAKRALADAVVEHGAPFLEFMYVDQPFWMRALPRMEGLYELYIYDVNADFGPALEEAIAHAGDSQQPLLRRLERVECQFSGGVGRRRRRQCRVF